MGYTVYAGTFLVSTWALQYMPAHSWSAHGLYTVCRQSHSWLAHWQYMQEHCWSAHGLYMQAHSWPAHGLYTICKHIAGQQMGYMCRDIAGQHLCYMQAVMKAFIPKVIYRLRYGFSYGSVHGRFHIQTVMPWLRHSYYCTVDPDIRQLHHGTRQGQQLSTATTQSCFKTFSSHHRRPHNLISSRWLR